jgi:4-amino-4-deoxy-L-arabinose transferase-like glycosyltransferase
MRALAGHAQQTGSTVTTSDHPAQRLDRVQKDHVMVLAYDYPLLGVFWSLLMFALFVLWIVIVIWCFIDNFRRRDHHGLAKALWFLFIVFVPVIGVFSYLVTRPAMVEVETVTEWPSERDESLPSPE